MADNQTRAVNSFLDKQPSIGPIPADQFFPWAVIILVSLLVVKGMAKADWITTGAFSFWGISSWYSLTYKDSWRFGSRFISPPHWTRGLTSYQSPLVMQQELREKKLNSRWN